MFCSGLDVPRPNLLLGVMVVNKPKTEKKPNVGPDAIVTTVVTNIGAAAEAKTLTPAPLTAISDGKKEKSGESDCFKLAEMT